MERVAIIENGPFLARHFEYFLDSAGIESERFPIWRGASLPGSIGDFGAFILTGDFHSILDGLKGYHERLLDFLLGLSDEKIFASCFSHQLIAHCRGGRIGRRDYRLLGWERVHVTGEHPAVAGDKEYSVFCVSSDEVTDPPGDSRVIASSDQCRFQVLAYGENILTCQGHPEITVGNGHSTMTLMGLMQGRSALHELRGSLDKARDDDSTRFMDGLIKWLQEP